MVAWRGYHVIGGPEKESTIIGNAWLASVCKSDLADIKLYGTALHLAGPAARQNITAIISHL